MVITFNTAAGTFEVTVSEHTQLLSTLIDFDIELDGEQILHLSYPLAR